MLLTRSPLVYPRKGLTARLACVKHAASVRPEPGSNSPLNDQQKTAPPGHSPLKGTALITSETKNNSKKPRPDQTHYRPSQATGIKQHGTDIRHTVEFSKNEHTPLRSPQNIAIRIRGGFHATRSRSTRPRRVRHGQPVIEPVYQLFRSGVPQSGQVLEPSPVRAGVRAPAGKKKVTRCARVKSNRWRPAHRRRSTPWSRPCPRPPQASGAITARARLRCGADHDGAPTSRRAGGRTPRVSTPRR